MLDVRNLSVNYGKHRALEDVSIRVDPGEIVVILGANGAGKSTLLRAISGICEGQHTGAIDIDGHPILGLGSDRIVEQGIALVPEGRGIFADLNVRENLTLGAYCNRARGDEKANLSRVMNLFPKLEERARQIVRTMSGGEQQMVAIGRAMMSNPSILMLDEPSLGLSPLLCKELFHNLTQVRQSGIGVLLVEQNAKQSLAIADRGYLLENAHIVHQDSAINLADDPAVQKAYLGVGGDETTKPAIPVTGDVPKPFAVANIPVLGRLRPEPTLRQSADSLIGRSIDELVREAAQSGQQPLHPSHPGQPRHPSHSSASSANSSTFSSHADRLRQTLSGIEQAAIKARKTSPGDLGIKTGSVGTPIPGQRSNGAAKSKPSPKVREITGGPLIEIWWRRPGTGKFEKDHEWRG